jgi:hypothetical protein
MLSEGKSGWVREVHYSSLHILLPVAPSAYTQMSPNVCQAGTVGWLVESIFFCRFVGIEEKGGLNVDK